MDRKLPRNCKEEKVTIKNNNTKKCKHTFSGSVKNKTLSFHVLCMDLPHTDTLFWNVDATLKVELGLDQWARASLQL